MTDRPDTQEEQEERSELVRAMYAPQMEAMAEIENTLRIAIEECALGLEISNTPIQVAAEQYMQNWLDQKLPGHLWEFGWDAKSCTLSLLG